MGKEQNRSIQKKHLINLINYLFNGLFLFFFSAVYFYSRSIIQSGFLNFSTVITLVIAILLYIPVVFMYFRWGGNPFGITRIVCLFMIVPTLMLFLSTSGYHQNFGGNIFEDVNPFLVISMFPFLFAIIINVLNGVFTFMKFRRHKSE